MQSNWILRIPTWLLFLIFGPLPLGTGWAMWFTRRYALVPRGVAFVTVGIVGFGCTVLLIAWLWSIGRTMNAAMQPSMRWRTVWVDLAVGYTIAYLLLVFVTFPWSESESLGLPLPILFRLHLAAMAAIFLADAWILRAIVVQRRGRFRIGYAFAVLALLWFYPVGVWFLHPWAQAAAAAAGTVEPVTT